MTGKTCEYPEAIESRFGPMMEGWLICRCPGTKKLRCTTRTVHVKVRTCAGGGASALQDTLGHLQRFDGESGRLWDYLVEQFPSMRRPMNFLDLTHRMYDLKGAFASESCPASFDRVSGTYRQPSRAASVECCCRWFIPCCLEFGYYVPL